MNKTNQGILVAVPGASYRPYCNLCSWQAQKNERTIPDAQVVARAHHSKEHS